MVMMTEGPMTTVLCIIGIIVIYLLTVFIVGIIVYCIDPLLLLLTWRYYYYCYCCDGIVPLASIDHWPWMNGLPAPTCHLARWALVVLVLTDVHYLFGIVTDRPILMVVILMILLVLTCCWYWWPMTIDDLTRCYIYLPLLFYYSLLVIVVIHLHSGEVRYCWHCYIYIVLFVVVGDMENDNNDQYGNSLLLLLTIIGIIGIIIVVIIVDGIGICYWHSLHCCYSLHLLPVLHSFVIHYIIDRYYIVTLLTTHYRVVIPTIDDDPLHWH